MEIIEKDWLWLHSECSTQQEYEKIFHLCFVNSLHKLRTTNNNDLAELFFRNCFNKLKLKARGFLALEHFYKKNKNIILGWNLNPEMIMWNSDEIYGQTLYK